MTTEHDSFPPEDAGGLRAGVPEETAAAVAEALERAGVFAALERTRSGVERGLSTLAEEVGRLEQVLRRAESGAAASDAVRAALCASAADLREGMRGEISEALDAAHRAGRELAAQSRADMRDFGAAVLKAAREAVDKDHRALEDRLDRGLAALNARLLEAQGRAEESAAELRGSAESVRAAVRAELSETLVDLRKEQAAAAESFRADLRALMRAEVAGIAQSFAEGSAQAADTLKTIQASFAEELRSAHARVERLEQAALERAGAEAARGERFEASSAALLRDMEDLAAALRAEMSAAAAAAAAARDAAQAAGPQAAAAASAASERTSKALLELAERVEALRPILQSIMTSSESARLAAAGAQRETLGLKDDMRFFSEELAGFNSSLGKTLETLGRIRDDVSPAVFGELKEVVGILAGELDALKARVPTGEELKSLDGAVRGAARSEDVRALGAALEGLRGGFDVLGERMDAAWKALRGRDDALLAEAFEPLREAVVRLQRGLAPLAGELRGLAERDEHSLERAERALRALSGKFDALSTQLVRLLEGSLHGHEALLRDLSARGPQEPPDPPAPPS